MARYKKNHKPKLTNDLILQLSAILRRGAYIETAVVFCGISKDSFYRWMREAEESTPGTLLWKLSEAVEVAKAEANLRDLMIIDRAAKGIPREYLLDGNGNFVLDELGQAIVKSYYVTPDWKAAAWKLERSQPKKWGKQALIADEEEPFCAERDRSIKIQFINPDGSVCGAEEL